MAEPLTLMSLFSGSGSFELAALHCGIQPVTASEIEPFAIRVTTKRLPQVRHLGDVCRINGADVPPVDIVTFGSPCTDVAVCGLKKGIHGKQSGLFFEAVRVIREMREATGGRSPRYAVMENVTGLYISSGGADFLEVLNALIQIKDPELSVPMPEKGRWPYAGEIVGDGFSLAYRTFDSQFWSCAQRRRRCYIVVDFGGECAGTVLFDETRLRGNPPQSRYAREGAAGSAAAGAGGAMPGVAYAAGFCTEHSAQSRSIGFEEEKSPTLRGTVVPGAVVYDARGNGDGRVVNTMTGDHNGHISDYTALAVEPVAYGISSYNSNAMLSDNPNSGIYEASTSRTLDANGGHPGCQQGGICVVSPPYIVRRLTPQECALLQGAPSDWCADLGTPEPTEEDIAFWTEVWETHRRIMGKSGRPKSRKQIVKWLRDPYTDMAEYALWGNAVSLPVAEFVLSGIALCGA